MGLCRGGPCQSHHFLCIGQNVPLREDFRIGRFILEGAENGIEYRPQRCWTVLQSAAMDREFPDRWHASCKLPSRGGEEVRLLARENWGKAFLTRGQDFRIEPLDKKFANVRGAAGGQDPGVKGKAVLPTHNSDAVLPEICRD